jgi:transposase InsO family protein
MLGCIEEYERIKRKESLTFKTVKAFCACHKFSHRNFMKICHRYRQQPCPDSPVPRRRGPKYRARRVDLQTGERVISLRQQGNNRYGIRDMLRQNAIFAPCPTTIYNICRRHGLNRLKPVQKQERRKIIMNNIGELVHVDCHQLSKGITIAYPERTYHLLGLVDGYSRVAWVEVLEDKKALTVMFAMLKALNILKRQYNLEVDAVLTDNGAEFGSGPATRNKKEHPFERLLLEMSIKHRYTRPYRPQTNGKVERFWRTLNEDFIEGALYENLDDLRNELLGFLVYYNEHRPHSAIGNITPIKMLNM